MKDGKTVDISFVRRGNICRSPTAEAVIRHLVSTAGLQDAITLDSAGTGAWHVGEGRDRRSRAVAKRPGMPISGPARQFVRGAPQPASAASAVAARFRKRRSCGEEFRRLSDGRGKAARGRGWAGRP